MSKHQQRRKGPVRIIEAFRDVGAVMEPLPSCVDMLAQDTTGGWKLYVDVKQADPLDAVDIMNRGIFPITAAGTS